MTDHELIEVASAITKNDWGEKHAIKVGKYAITQFQGTAFESDYSCYKIQWLECNSSKNIIHERKLPCAMVAKITNSTEENILYILSQRGFPVPKIEAVLRSSKGSVMIFTEMLPGQELYSCSADNAWIDAITTLSQIHCEFCLSKNSTLLDIPSSNTALEKLQRAYTHTIHNSDWTAYMEEIIDRMKIAPHTLIHGDMFPTNILVNQDKCAFIDWADAGMSPYMMDIGRLTAIIDKRTLLPMCPCPDKVIETYFKLMEDCLQISHERYLKDVFMAQFVELACFYVPPGYLGYNEKCNQLIERKMMEIVTANNT